MSECVDVCEFTCRSELDGVQTVQMLDHRCGDHTLGGLIVGGVVGGAPLTEFIGVTMGSACIILPSITEPSIAVVEGVSAWFGDVGWRL